MTGCRMILNVTGVVGGVGGRVCAQLRGIQGGLCGGKVVLREWKWDDEGLQGKLRLTFAALLQRTHLVNSVGFEWQAGEVGDERVSNFGCISPVHFADNNAQPGGLDRGLVWPSGPPEQVGLGAVAVDSGA